MFLKRHMHYVFFGIMLGIGLLTFKQYGMGWDEPRQREIAEINYAYVFKGHPALLTLSDRAYGVGFELPLYMIERVLDMNDTRKVYLMRHLLVHVFFLFGAFFAFRLVDHLYKNKWLASLAFFLIVLHPRLYGHSFFNTKDIPFLSMFIISTYYAVKALDRRTLLSFVVLGLCCGLLINMRIMGIIIPTMVFVLLLLDAAVNRQWKLNLKMIGVLLLFSSLTLYATWPFLWENPIENFVFAFKQMSQYPWMGKVLFEGKLINSVDIPERYAPVWMGITTPIAFLLIIAVGVVLTLVYFFKASLSHLKNGLLRHNLMFLGFGLGPLLMVILLNSVLYDGWRQLYFIYPSLCFVGIYGLHKLLSLKFSQKVMALILVPLLALTVWEIGRCFPYQHVYFNKAFVFEKEGYEREHFETDYWGVSFKNALEKVMQEDKDSLVSFTMSNQAGVWNHWMLPRKERKRIRMVPAERAKYMITNYRWHPQDYAELDSLKLQDIRVQGNTINSVFLLNNHKK